MRRAAGIGALGLGLVVAGGVFDGEPLYVPGVGFLVLAVLAAAWVALGARGVTLSRTLDARRVVEGEPLGARVDVRLGPFPVPPGTVVVDPLVSEPMRVRSLGPRRAAMRITVRFTRRGPRLLPAPRLLARDPFDLARREVVAQSGDEVLVLPRTHPVRANPGGGAGRLGRSALLMAMAAVEVDGLRPYREGAPASRIHWPAAARGAGLMERRLRADGDARPLVVLDARGAASEEDVDAAVRAAASLCLALANAGGCALLLGGERRASTVEPDLIAWPAAHARLALVEGGKQAIAPALAAGGARMGPLVYVSARRIERLPGPAAAVARGPRILVVPGSLPGRIAAFEVAACHGYDLGARAAGRARSAGVGAVT